MGLGVCLEDEGNVAAGLNGAAGWFAEQCHFVAFGDCSGWRGSEEADQAPSALADQHVLDVWHGLRVMWVQAATQ